MLEGFKKFLLRGNVIDLAVGIVIGAAFGSLVTALVKDLLTPFVGAVMKAPDFSALSFTINDSQFLYGDFINALISFLISAASIYFFVVLPLGKFAKKDDKKEPTTKKCSECDSTISIKAKRCPNCTSQLN